MEEEELYKLLNLPNLESLVVQIKSFPSKELPEMANLSKLSLSFKHNDVFETDIFCKALKKMPNLKRLQLEVQVGVQLAIGFAVLDSAESLKNEKFLRICKEVFVTVSQTKNIVVDNRNHDGTILKIYRKNSQPSDAEIETLYFTALCDSRKEFFETLEEIVDAHLKNHSTVIVDKEK